MRVPSPFCCGGTPLEPEGTLPLSELRGAGVSLSLGERGIEVSLLLGEGIGESLVSQDKGAS